MKFHILTLFPDMVMQGLDTSILGRAKKEGKINIQAVNIRDYTQDKHGKVDDYPYGGGAGMLIQAQPVFDAWRAVTEAALENPAPKKIRTLYMTPQGRPFTQALAKELALEEELIFLCGHYEGIDERVLEEIVTDYVSLGDFVLTGGELPAMVMIDAIARLVPEVLHNEESSETESFYNDLLEYPQYSRPPIWHEKEVPKVLFCGDHKKIQAWRLEQSVLRTKKARPDLYEKYAAKMALVEKLSKKKRLYMHMIEALLQDQANICFDEGEYVALYMPSCKLGLVSGPIEEGDFDPERALAMLYALPKDIAAFVSTCEALNYLLQEKYAMAGIMACTQAVYTNKVPLPVKLCRKLQALQTAQEASEQAQQTTQASEQAPFAARQELQILPLEEKDLSYAVSHYDHGDEAYLRKQQSGGKLYGLYKDRTCLGFIGIHEDGSMGMLYVDAAYRGLGLAMALESFLINTQLKKGRTPYCHIINGNDASLQLQKKLGLYLSTTPIWWIYHT